MKIYPYSAASASAKELSLALGIKRLKREGEPINLRHQKVINWGCSAINRELINAVILNPPEAVAKASNKLKAFRAMNGEVGIPEWTTDHQEAIKWLRDGSVVVARTILNGHSGEGIVLVDQEEDNLPVAPLYTRYIPKKSEYRLHVHDGKVFFVQRKARNRDVPDDKVNWKIRNHVNGFIFSHVDVDVEDDAKEQAVLAINALGLDFGAVDIIQSSKDKKWYVLEVNTACGLAGETVKKYVEQFERYV